MKTWTFILALLVPCMAMARLGETKEECDRRYRPFRAEHPPRFPGSTLRRVYIYQTFRIDIEFNQEGKACVLMFRPRGAEYLSQLVNQLARKNMDRDFDMANEAWTDGETFDVLDTRGGGPYFEDPIDRGKVREDSPMASGAEIFTFKSDARQKNAREHAAQRDHFAIAAANDIREMPQFFENFYPGLRGGLWYGDQRGIGSVVMYYDILNANTGPGEWRDNETLEPLLPPTAAPNPGLRSERPKPLVDDLESSTVLHLHRSDRRAFALQCPSGLFLWSREADIALLKYAAQKSGDLKRLIQGKRGKF